MYELSSHIKQRNIRRVKCGTKIERRARHALNCASRATHFAFYPAKNSIEIKNGRKKRKESAYAEHRLENQIRIGLYTRSVDVRSAGFPRGFVAPSPAFELIFAQRMELNYSWVVGYWERAR